jgi:hypothetical protein
MSPFKDALERFRCRNDLEPANREHIERWARDERADALWDRFHREAPEHKPEGLITGALFARCAAELFERIGRPRRSNKLRKTVSNLLLSDSPDWRVAPFLEHAAEYLRNEPEIYQVAPDILPDYTVRIVNVDSVDAEALGLGLESSAPQVIADPDGELPPLLAYRNVRQNVNNSRPRRTFKILLSEQMKLIRGNRLDDLVAALTEIAFPGGEVDADHVRPARRPTTRKARKRNTQFPATAGK